MAMVINTNLASLSAQRHLTNSRADMETAMERLSSGKRINQAGDDAAGLTIAHQMDNQIASLGQAQRNANDGIAMINMAEGAMDQFSNMLTRMKELAVQSSNGIYSSTDRTNLNEEFAALKTEISRIADVTIYNGINVLNDSATTQSFQVGDLSSDQIDVTFQDMRSSTIGAVQATSTVATDTAGNTVASAGDGQISVWTVASIATADYLELEIEGTTYTQDVGNNILETLTSLAGQIQVDEPTFTFAIASTAANTASLTITSATNTSFDYGDLLGVDETTSGAANLNAASITSASYAGIAMAAIDQAIKDVDTYRSELGAKANQLEHTASNLQTRIQYTSAARSQIMDADYAVESANLAKAQVLQQAGTAMLAQANASTQNVLSLLK